MSGDDDMFQELYGAPSNVTAQSTGDAGAAASFVDIDLAPEPVAATAGSATSGSSGTPQTTASDQDSEESEDSSSEDLDIVLETLPDDSRKSVSIKPAASGSGTAYQEPVTTEEREELTKRAEKLRAELEGVEKRLGLSAAERTSSRIGGPDQGSRTKYEFLEALALPNEKTYEIDFELLPDKPWRKPGADISDYFNYGFDEDTWRAYCSKQIHHRLRSGLTDKIAVVEGGGPITGNHVIPPPAPGVPRSSPPYGRPPPPPAGLGRPPPPPPPPGALVSPSGYAAPPVFPPHVPQYSAASVQNPSRPPAPPLQSIGQASRKRRSPDEGENGDARTDGRGPAKRERR